MSLALRVKQRMDQLGIRQNRLAELCGVRQPQISRLLNGHVDDPSYIYELSKALETSVKWLKTGVEDHEYGAASAHRDGWREDSAVKAQSARKIPVFAVLGGGEGDKYRLDSGASAIEFVAPLPAQAGDRDAFGLLVHGDTMLPRYEPGWIVCVHTRRPAQKGRDCVVEMVDGAAYIRTLIDRADDAVVFGQLTPRLQFRIPRQDVRRILPVVGVIMER